MKRNFNLFKQEIAGKRVAVVGIGVSNIPLIRFLVKLGAKVTAFDRRDFEELDSAIEEYRTTIEFSLGEKYLYNLEGFDVIFRTPGMRPDQPELLKAKAAGAVITSEMREFMRHCPATTIGITGSDGKSTTTTMTHGLLKAQGLKSRIGGNIGFPLFDQIEEITPDEFIVLELSSFQLMDMDLSPDIAVVTNLSPNHLDVHRSLAEYQEAKQNIYKFQDETGVLILNQDNEITRSFKADAKGQVKTFSSKGQADARYEDDVIYLGTLPVVNLSQMQIKGTHNAENFCAALLATQGLVDTATAREFALTFTGVKHRAQFVAEKRAVRYYNDSIASSPTRALATVKSFSDDKGRINIILGGKDKNLDFTELAQEGGPYFRNVILLGAARQKIYQAFVQTGGEISESLYEAASFDEAVQIAAKVARPGDVVLLSPACTSFDMFKNFEERGDHFKELVEAMEE